MKLIIGGCYQGKLAYVIRTAGLTSAQIADGESCNWQNISGIVVLDHLHLLIKRLLQVGEDAKDVVGQLVAENPEIIIISDEIGYGLVPVDAFERQWREATGRICCRLAEQAGCVLRISCGLPLVLKGEIDA